MIIGIDPGLDGAIALLSDSNQYHNVYDMPVMTLTGKRRQVNAAELTRYFAQCQRSEGTNFLTAYLERVSAMPGQGVTGMFSFGMSYGIVQGVLAALQIPVTLVTPQSWKKRARLLGKEKDAARALAQQLYPQAALGRKKDIGRADAILIARFGPTSGYPGKTPPFEPLEDT